MAQKTEIYATRILMRQGKRAEALQGWRAIQTDRIAGSFHVLFDNTVNPISPKFLRKRVLKAKIKDNTITFNEFREYSRLINL